MLVVALVIGQLTAGLKVQARGGHAARARACAACTQMSRELSAALLAEQVARDRRALPGRRVRGARARCWWPTPTTGCSRCPARDARGRHGRRAVGVRPSRSRPGAAPTRCPASAVLYLPLKRADAHARRAGDRAQRSRAPARPGAAPPARHLRLAAGDLAGAHPLHRRRRRRARCRWSPSGCATRCWRRSRTTCARRSPRWSGWPIRWR